ncbi:MAG: hypothetical protein AAB268_02780 [Elusimicrobiota bacterium]
MLAKPSRARRTFGGEWAVAALVGSAFSVAAGIMYGYVFGRGSNHFFYLPYVLSRLDPSLYGGDIVVAALRRGAPTLFWDFLAAAAGPFGLECAAFGLWVGSRALAGAATYAAARSLGARVPGGVLAVVLVLFSSDVFWGSAFSGDPMLKTSIDQTSFAWPFVLCCVTAWLRGHTVAPLTLLGLLAHLNPMLAAIGAAWLIGAGLLERRGLRALSQGAALFLLAAGPIYGRVLARGGGDLQVMMICAPQNYLPAQWPAEKWIKAAAEALFAVAVIQGHPARGRLTPLFFSAAGLWALTMLAAIVPSSRGLLALQFFRLDVATVWLSLMAAAPVLEKRLSAATLRAFCPAAVVAWSLALPLASPVFPAWSAALLSAGESPMLAAAAGAAGLLYGCTALFADPSGLWSARPSMALSAALAGALALYAVVSAPARRLGPRARAVGLAVLAALALALAAPLIRRPRPPDDELAAVASWAWTTPPAAAFLVHPLARGFRLAARRPVYAEWTDFNLALWDGVAARDWKRRMSRLGMDWENFAHRFARQQAAWEGSLLRHSPGEVPDGPAPWTQADASRLSEAALSAGVSYLVVPERLVIPWPVSARFPGIIIYATPGGSP